MALLRLSDEWVADSINGVQIIEDTLIREMSVKLDSFGLVGTGSNQPAGLINFGSGLNTVTQAPGSMDYDDVLDAVDAIRQDSVEPNGWVLSSSVNTVLSKLKKNSEANNYADPPTDVAALKKFVTEAVTSSYVLVGDWTQYIWAVRQDILLKKQPQVDRNAQLVSVTARVDYAAQHNEAFCKISA
jgi:HK97 family phage major capsid protein